MAGLSRLARLLVVVSLLAPVVLRGGEAAADPVADKRAQALRLSAQLDGLNRRSSQLAEAYNQARLHLADVNTRLDQARAALGSTDSQLGGARARLRDMAVQSYMQGGAAAQLSLLIPASADQIALRGTYVRSVTANTNDAVDALHEAHANLARLQAQLTAAQTEANRAMAQVQANQKAAAAADAAVAAAYAKAQAQLGAELLQQARAQRIAAEQARIQAQIAAGREQLPPASSVKAAKNGLHLVTPVAVIGTPSLNRGQPTGGGSPAPKVTDPAPLPPPGAGASSAIAWAKAELGVPYVYGGSGPGSFDCSGLTAWAWGHAGHPLPHSSEAQYSDTTHVPVSELQPGDLVFYGMPPHHVGIYVGGGMMINALHSGTNVEYDSIYMEGDLIGGGRIN